MKIFDEINEFHVIKRDGSKEPFLAKKIMMMVEWASDSKSVSPVQLYTKFIPFMVDGMSTEIIQSQLIKVALSLTSIEEPDWADVAGSLLLLNIYKNHKKYMGNNSVFGYSRLFDFIKKATEDKLYNPEILGFYTEEEIDSLNQEIDIEYDVFDYSGINLFDKRYLCQFNGDTVEPPQFMYMATAMMVFKDYFYPDKIKQIKDYYSLMATQKISPATPNLSNLRKYGRGSSPSCFTLKVEDNLESIYDNIKKAAIISKNGGASGVSLSAIRANGSSIKGVPGSAKGVIPWARLFNDTAVAVDQLSTRVGAITVELDVWHKDIFDFLNMRKENIDLRMQCQDLFGQIGIMDIFVETYNQAVKNDTRDNDWLLLCPHEFYRISGIEMDKVWGQEFRDAYAYAKTLHLEGNLPNSEMVSSRELMKKILETAKETGLPYWFNKDYVNECNPNKHLGMIHTLNLCVAPETLLFTKNGSVVISDVVNTYVEVWNGFEFSLSKVIKTGTNQSLTRVIVEKTVIESDSVKTIGLIELDCTSYHKWYNSDGFEIRTFELKVGTDLLEWVNSDGKLIKTKVVEILKDFAIKDTFCVTEPIRHMAVFNGILTGQCVESFSVTNENLSHICNLHSVNLANTDTDEEIEESVRMSVRGLNQIVLLSTSPLECTRKHNDLFRIIGIGILGYHDHLVKKKIMYTSSANYMYELMEKIAYWAIDESVNEVAKIGEAPAFSGSDWEKGIFFGRSVYDEDFTLTPGMARNWINLYENKVAKFGMANTGLLAIAPNTGTSQLVNSSASILPVFSKFFKEKNRLMVVPFAAKFLSTENFWLYQEGININPSVVIDVCQSAQAWIDQGISMELNFNTNLYNDIGYLRDWYLKSMTGNPVNNLRSKSVYYIRPIEKDRLDSCSSCAN